MTIEEFLEACHKLANEALAHGHQVIATERRYNLHEQEAYFSIEVRFKKQGPKTEPDGCTMVGAT